MSKRTKWVRVEDRLPEEDTPVLVYWGGDINIESGAYDTQTECWWTLSGTERIWGVSHWRPMPKPPRAPAPTDEYIEWLIAEAEKEAGR